MSCDHCFNASNYMLELIESVCCDNCGKINFEKGLKLNLCNLTCDGDIFNKYLDKQITNCNIKVTLKNKNDCKYCRVFNSFKLNFEGIISEERRLELDEEVEKDKVKLYINNKLSLKKDFKFGECDFCKINSVRYAIEIFDDVKCTCGHRVIMRDKFYKNVCSTQCQNSIWIPIEYETEQMDLICRFIGYFHNLKCKKCSNDKFKNSTFIGSNLFLMYP
jgi:hypothetical protein